jgi:hypothetical protein
MLPHGQKLPCQEALNKRVARPGLIIDLGIGTERFMQE